LQVPTVAPLHTSERPQSLSHVQDFVVQPELRQSSLPQWLSRVHMHLPLVQLPRSQGLLLEQEAGTHVPTAPPTHDAPDIEQSLADVQLWTVQVPLTGGVHVAPKPQSVSTLHELLDTSASAETWKSLKTTRPHWLAGVAATGVLNVMLRSMSVVEELADLPYIQRWLGGLMADLASHRGSLIDI
jgi:hypothetical protein